MYGYIPPISWIVQVVANQCGLKHIDLEQRDRTKGVSLARQIAMYLCWNYEGYTLAQIGKALGGRTPSTVSYGYQAIAKALPADEGLRDLVARIKKELEP